MEPFTFKYELLSGRVIQIGVIFSSNKNDINNAVNLNCDYILVNPYMQPLSIDPYTPLNTKTPYRFPKLYPTSEDISNHYDGSFYPSIFARSIPLPKYDPIKMNQLLVSRGWFCKANDYISNAEITEIERTAWQGFTLKNNNEKYSTNCNINTEPINFLY